MEVAVRVHAEELPEVLFLATSEDLPGPVARERTVSETLEIARDVARKLIEARREREGEAAVPAAAKFQDYTIVVAASADSATAALPLGPRAHLHRCCWPSGF